MNSDPIVAETRSRRAQVERQAKEAGEDLYHYVLKRQQAYADRLVKRRPQEVLKRKTA
jgi:KaiC/GvpD/RAD55 family RecA-like ATPase